MTAYAAGDAVIGLSNLAEALARESAGSFVRRHRPRRGETLKPGPETPLWNAVATAVAAEFRKRGERVRLARVLRLPRQRVTEMLRSRRRLPDAERTLELLVWLHARRHGRDLG
jgi:hypothetical protein